MMSGSDAILLIILVAVFSLIAIVTLLFQVRHMSLDVMKGRAISQQKIDEFTRGFREDIQRIEHSQSLTRTNERQVWYILSYLTSGLRARLPIFVNEHGAFLRKDRPPTGPDVETLIAIPDVTLSNQPSERNLEDDQNILREGTLKIGNLPDLQIVCSKAGEQGQLSLSTIAPWQIDLIWPDGARQHLLLQKGGDQAGYHVVVENLPAGNYSLEVLKPEQTNGV